MCIGANIIRLLAHGNPILEPVGRIVYPEDVPSEIIDEIFELIKAEKPLRALSDLWKTAKKWGKGRHSRIFCRIPRKINGQG
ncbi:hypothetical protein CEXT_780541 [Caerostris extrusa]|uniref:Uncharacterized protein n=1 Tax=Caerostris extrusa TaxID=172846 RepID=A0AAV4XGS2_CAEEX|nr:hypothetical protein CEXT_780541 [Caerostris extrusa]